MNKDIQKLAEIIKDNMPLVARSYMLNEALNNLAQSLWDADYRNVKDIELPDRPRIVCLCGSTKFKQEFIIANFRETMAGNIVLTVGWFSHADGNIYTPTPKEKIALDELHKRKIDLADEVVVINVGGYIGESTKSEIEYAKSQGKKITYLHKPSVTLT